MYEGASQEDNPKTHINNNNDSYISKIDTSTNNKELYQIKKKIKERGKINNGG